MPGNLPPSSWILFDICDTCGVGAKKACVNLKISTSKKIIIAGIPHRGRERL